MYSPFSIAFIIPKYLTTVFSTKIPKKSSDTAAQSLLLFCLLSEKVLLMMSTSLLEGHGHFS